VLREGGLADPQVAALITHHRTESSATTPICNAHSLDSEGLSDPTISFVSAWDGDALLGIGALKMIDIDHGELKSMRTAPDHLRKGVARSILEYLMDKARERGARRLSLETGTAPMFQPAIALYRRQGFVECATFGGYPPSPHNLFMTMDL